MNIPKVSVIIPVYNVEKYLSRCLDSVINQTIKDIEIICVNDCTQDNCNEILKRYQKYDNRINIIKHDKNRGLSAARNTGLSNMHGKYIYFLDSDDWIDSDYIEKMVLAIEQNAVPIILNTNIFCHYEKATDLSKMTQPWQSRKINAEFNDKNTIFSLINKYPMSVCYLYRKDFLNKGGLKFPEGLRHEDQYFSHIILPYLDKLCVIFGPRYHYLKRENSITGSWNKTIDYYDMIDILAEIYNYYKQHEFLDEYPIPFGIVMNHFRLHSDPENFIKRVKLLFAEMESDIMSRRHLYDRVKLTAIFNVVLSGNNVSEIRQKSNDSGKKILLLLDKLRDRVCQGLSGR
jgi:glycosyltransferase involved in cell wall biosynthesis